MTIQTEFFIIEIEVQIRSGLNSTSRQPKFSCEFFGHLKRHPQKQQQITISCSNKQVTQNNISNQYLAISINFIISQMKYLPNSSLFAVLAAIICIIALNFTPKLSQTSYLTQSNSLKLNYPIKLVQIDQITHWTTPQKIAAGLEVPGYATSTIYNYITLAFWTHKKGPDDIASIWADPIKYFGSINPFGKTKDEVQQNLKKLYNDKEVKILISAFGATQFPTTSGIDPFQCATKLGNFVLQNNLDGVDIYYQDNKAMQAGTAEQWIITFQTRLRQLLPNHIISHAPQAPYFKKQYYKNGAYITVDQKIGRTIY